MNKALALVGKAVFAAYLFLYCVAEFQEFCWRNPTCSDQPARRLGDGFQK